MLINEKSKKEPIASTEDVRNYWKKENIPQQWYTSKEPLSLAYFNDIAKERYEKYYPYLKEKAEFQYHAYESVLEIGVGLGTDLIQFAINKSLVYGIDLGKDQIEITKQHFIKKNCKFEDLRVASAENIPYENNKFDLVYSFGVLHHTPNTEKAVDEIYRVLKKDGEAIIMLYAKGWKHYFKRILIHGILKGKLIKYKFNMSKINNEVSEVNGKSPKTEIYTKKKIIKLFKKFKTIEIEKCRLGEFFEYRPYKTLKFPKFIANFFKLLSIESILGENYIIKIKKKEEMGKDNLLNVIFKHY
jgi:ubiquinone/menaquinone biosynthesis C-methylase UbiE